MKNIIRISKKDNYVVLDKTFLNDKTLSWKAKGIMAYMLSKPDDWTFYMNELEKHAIDGKSSLQSGFKELRNKGYVVKRRTQDENGQFEWETIVHEVPYTDFPSMEKPSMENQPLLSNDSLSNEELNNDEVIVEIINYLNTSSDKNYKHTTKKTKTLINARLEDGFSLNDFKRVIDVKVDEWKDDRNMNKYLRPETLFGTKFESYLNQKDIKKEVDLDEFDLND